MVGEQQIWVDDRQRTWKASDRPGQGGHRPGQGEHCPGYGYNRVMNDQLFQTFYNDEYCF